jgi:UDP-glucuronate 4-epimerase
MNFLVTGGAGFIGSHLIDALLREGHFVVNIDNFDGYYQREIKERNIASHLESKNSIFIEGNINDGRVLDRLFDSHSFDAIIHLAAKAGVRPSIENPALYEQVNGGGTLALLEKAKENKIGKFIFASSSSVYGSNPHVPWKETDLDLRPISPYAGSKIAAESYGKVYCDLCGLHFIALRFFTVFGPRQRPDLAIHKFFDLIYSGQKIPFFGTGGTSRDYTFVDDIIGGVMGAIKKEPKADLFEIFNLGNSKPVSLAELVAFIETITGKKALLNRLPMQKGDVERTCANIVKAQQELNYSPETSMMDGLKAFDTWFRSIRK